MLEFLFPYLKKKISCLARKRPKVKGHQIHAKENMKIATCMHLHHLLGSHNALNLTATTVYLLAPVTFMFLEALMALSLIHI